MQLPAEMTVDPFDEHIMIFRMEDVQNPPPSPKYLPEMRRDLSFDRPPTPIPNSLPTAVYYGVSLPSISQHHPDLQNDLDVLALELQETHLSRVTGMEQVSESRSVDLVRSSEYGPTRWLPDASGSL
ncbi:hypothetical protein PSACC_02935 [Paramicrosporidium saccamoebae]|uniref:Uncharacterized protein n=1 Tax=Paramicrosporidium saccamoebae TaxID=1246581 RepID=A0A2H9THP5_9FUNG|nr:hypothetical protein PSACC_02935 [Paramicrosporidium saccamoebae]